jgi:short-subunit dehydrogenase
VTNQQDLERMISICLDQLGELNVFVHNAGVGAVGKLLDTDVKTWDLLMTVNAKGTFMACKAAAMQMIKQGKGGRIIINASGAGKIAPGKDMPLGAYAASKPALNALAEALRVEVRGDGVQVIVVAPGPTATAFRAMAPSADGTRRGPPGRLATSPEAVGRAIVRAAERGSREVVVGVGARVTRRANQLLPGTVDAVVRVVAGRPPTG